MFWLGMDIGQAADYSAVTIVEAVFKQHGRHEDGSPKFDKNLYCRHVQRLPLQMTYPDQVTQIGKMMQSNPLKGQCMIAVDATGVGRPVIDLMHEQKLSPMAVTITGGLDENMDPKTGYWSVPKRILISNLQVLLGNGLLLFADGLEMKNLLIAEITNFKIKITSKGNDTYEAWREGDHDDLVLSLALACWAANRFSSPPRTQQQNPWLLRRQL
jgi:hypothetical protein